MNAPRHVPRAWLGGFAWLLLVAMAITAALAGARQWSAAPSVEVVLRMSKTSAGMVQLFASTGAGTGYREDKSVTLDEAAPNVAHDYPLRLSDADALRAFRVDPGSGPGRVTLHRVDIHESSASTRLEGAELRSATRPLNDLVVEDAGDGLSFVSLGDDPYLEVTLPQSLLKDHKASRRMGRLLGMAGLAGLLVLLWFAPVGLLTLAKREALRLSALFALTLVSALALLWILKTGCDGWCSANGVRYGSKLLLASVSMALVGAAVLSMLGLGKRPGRLRLFLWIAVGQAVLLIYVMVRSVMHASMPMLALGGTEVLLVVVASAVYLGLKAPRSITVSTPRGLSWLALEGALLVAICLVVADRELPRLIMLSSDPDTHAYLARQVEVLGGIPWRGEGTFQYPGGTAALGFLWAKLGFLDVRDAITAMPLLQSFLAALMLGEAIALRARPTSDRLTVMLTLIGITAAGFLIPLYVDFSHMEGAGRQIAIASAAMVPALLLAGNMTRTGADRTAAAVLLLSLFALGVLNPISLVVPIVLAVAYVLYIAMAQRRVNAWWVAALVASPALLLLDPYYFYLLAGQGISPSKVTVNEAMPIKEISEILSSWQLHHARRPLGFLFDSMWMSRRESVPLFAVFLASLLTLLILLKPSLRMSRAAVVAGVVTLIALVAIDGLFGALGDDRRFYLLAPYYSFTLVQLKVLLVTALAGMVMVMASVRKLRPPLLAMLALAMVSTVHVGMRGSERILLEPRVNYCGSLGCVSEDDLIVMARFEDMHQLDKHLPPHTGRVLVPNSVHDTHNEDWVFPVAGARALPFHDVLPVAFFYYQGDDDYTTENYKAHVCHHFDRDWLRRQQITHVFLPSSRADACMKDMESLPMSEEVLIQHGNSYLLRLR